MLRACLLFGGGLCGGTLGGFLGLGGGIVLMPLLRFVVGLSPAETAGTCITAVFCTTLGGSYRHLRQGQLRPWSIAPLIAAGAAASGLCSLAFGTLARRGNALDLGIGLVFLAIAARMLATAGARAPARRPAADNAVRGPLPLKLAVGAAAGALPGLLGIGSGGILVPAFTLLLRTPVKTAMAASLCCYVFTSAISAAFKLWQGYVVFGTAAPLCLGTLVGANLGAMINRRARSRVVQQIFGGVFLLVALRFIISFAGS